MASDVFIFAEPVSATQFCSAIVILCICVAVGYEKIRLNNLKQRLIDVTRIEKH